MEKVEEIKIIVFYVDVRGVTDIHDSIFKIKKEIDSSAVFNSDNITSIVLPVLGNSRIECINPKYITDVNLISKHQIMMKELHEHLEYQIQQLKDIKDQTEKTITHFNEKKLDETTTIKENE